MSKPKLPSGQAIVWKKDRALNTYANIMGFTMTPFDITLFLGQIEEATETEVIADAKVAVSFTPEQAANLVKLLTGGLNAYITANGPLRQSGALDLNQLKTEIEKSSIQR